MATPEGKVKAKVKIILKSIGAYFAMPMGTGYGNSGVPDFLVCFRGWFIGIETKTEGNEPTALQMKNLFQIQRAGGWALVIDEETVVGLEQFLLNLPERNENGASQTQ